MISRGSYRWQVPKPKFLQNIQNETLSLVAAFCTYKITMAVTIKWRARLLRLQICGFLFSLIMFTISLTLRLKMPLSDDGITRIILYLIGANGTVVGVGCSAAQYYYIKSSEQALAKTPVSVLESAPGSKPESKPALPPVISASIDKLYYNPWASRYVLRQRERTKLKK